MADRKSWKILGENGRPLGSNSGLPFARQMLSSCILLRILLKTLEEITFGKFIKEAVFYHNMTTLHHPFYSWKRPCPWRYYDEIFGDFSLIQHLGLASIFALFFFSFDASIFLVRLAQMLKLANPTFSNITLVFYVYKNEKDTSYRRDTLTFGCLYLYIWLKQLKLTCTTSPNWVVAVLRFS